MTNFTHNILSIHFHFNNLFNSVVNNPVIDAPKRELFEKIQRIVADTINFAKEANHECTKDLEALKTGLDEFGSQQTREKAEAIKQLVGDIQIRILKHLLNDAVNGAPGYIRKVYGKTVEDLPAFEEWCEIVDQIDNPYVIDLQLTAIQETLHWVTDEKVPFVSKKLCRLAKKIDNAELDPDKTLMEIVLRVAREKPVLAEALLDGIDEVEYDGTKIEAAIKEFTPDVALKVILRMKNIQEMDSESFDVNRFLRIHYARVERTNPLLAFEIICKMTNIPYRIDFFFKFFQRFEYDIARIKKFSASIPKECLRQRFFCEAVRMMRNYNWLVALDIVKWLIPGPMRDEGYYLMAHSLNAQFDPPTAFTMLFAISNVDLSDKGFTEVVENESNPRVLFGWTPHKVMTEQVLNFAFGAYSLLRPKLAFEYICKFADNALANYLYNIWIKNLHANGKTEIAVAIVKEVVAESSQPALLAEIEKIENLKRKKEDPQPKDDKSAKKSKGLGRC